jgi:uncharacterized protein YndB with AHSA1/START domain
MSDAGGGDDVRLQIHIEASPATVFALLTDAAQMTSWLGALVEADPRPGGVFRAASHAGLAIEGTYLELIPNQKVVFTWGGVEGLAPGQSTVEFMLEPDRGGTLLRLRHYRLPGPAAEAHRATWLNAGLPKLKDASEGRVPATPCLSDDAAHGGV